MRIAWSVALLSAGVLGAADGPQRTLLAKMPVEAVFFSPDGKTVTASSRNKGVCTWDAASGNIILDRQILEGGRLLTSNLVAEPVDGSPPGMRLWDLTADRRLQMINGTPSGRPAISPDRKQLAVSSAAGRSVVLTNLANSAQRHTLADGVGGAASLVFSPDGTTLVSANYDNDVRIWKTQSGELVKKIEDLTGAMFAVEFTPDGKQLVLGGLDETVYIRDAKTYALDRTFKGHGETIAALAISPDGRTLVTGGFDVIAQANPVKVVFWDLATGKITRTVTSPHCVASLAFSPDGKWLAMTAVGSKEVSLYSVEAISKADGPAPLL